MIGVKLNTKEFGRTLAAYLQVSKKDIADIINAKAFYIARGAARNTIPAGKEDIRSGLEKMVTVKDALGRTREAPIVGVMAEQWAKKKHGRGYAPSNKSDLEGLRAAVGTIKAARMRARAFMRSGWLPAIKGFARKMKAVERFEAGSKMLGMLKTSYTPKGGFSAAQPGIMAKAILWNASAAKRGQDPGGKLNKIAGAALQAAIEHEIASMKSYIVRKLSKTANDFKRR